MIFIDPKLWAVASGTPIGNVDVGDIIQLNEGGVPVDYIVVHQGRPSSIYDASCNGTWLLRQNIYSLRVYGDAGNPNFKDSSIKTWLNTSMKELYDSNIQQAIKTVKIPYMDGGWGADLQSGANGLSCDLFILSCAEIGWNESVYNYFSNDGATLDYFITGESDEANLKRVAKYNNTAAIWWTRTPNTQNLGGSVLTVPVNGKAIDGYSPSQSSPTGSNGVRPCFILPQDFVL